MGYVDIKMFNWVWVFVRCTALMVLLFAGAVRAFAFSHPLEVEVHTEAENFKGSVENDRANKESYDRVNEGRGNERDLDRALDYMNDRMA
jgi:hypothetical protein